MGDTSEDVTRILVQLDTIQEDMLITQALYVNDLFLLILLRACSATENDGNDGIIQ